MSPAGEAFPAFNEEVFPGLGMVPGSADYSTQLVHGKEASRDAVSRQGSSLPPAAIISCHSRAAGCWGRWTAIPRLLLKQFVFLLPINWCEPLQGLLPTLLRQGGLWGWSKC